MVRPIASTSHRVLGLFLLVIVAGGTSCTDMDEGEPWDVGEDVRAPEVASDGYWRPTSGPPLSGWVSNPSESSFIGMLGADPILRQGRSADARLVRVSQSDGTWETIAGLETILDEDSTATWIGDVGGTVYMTTNDGTYRRSDDGRSWQREPYPFWYVFVIEDTLFGVTHTHFEQAPSTLFRKEPGEDWARVVGDVYDATVTGDLLHVYHNGDELEHAMVYSDDGGRNWTPHERNVQLLFGSTGGLEHNGEYWGAMGRVGRIYHSADGASWEIVQPDSIEGRADTLIHHNDTIFAIERSERVEYVQATDKIIKLTDEGWVATNAPQGLRILQIASTGDSLLAMTRGAGLWRSSDAGESWHSVGPSLSAPGYIAAADNDLCALDPVIGVASCRSSSDTSWVRYGLDEELSFETVFGDDDRLFLYARLGEVPYTTSQIWQLEDGQLEAVTDESLDAGIIERAFEHDEELYVLRHRAGLGRVEDDGTAIDELTVPLHGDFSYYNDAISAHGQLWFLSTNGDNYDLKRAADGSNWESAKAGLPGDGASDHRPPHAVSFASTDQALYTLVYSYHDVDGETQTRGDVYRWSPEHKRWYRTAVPSWDELGEDFFRFIRGGGRTVYASTMTGVYQFDATQNEWVSISEGLDAEISPRSLEVHDQGIYVGVSDRGMYEYVFDVPSDEEP